MTNDHPHRRYNPLTGEYVLVSPHRMKRPWQGQVEKTTSDHRPAYDPTCYLCPGNERAGGIRNPQYSEPFVFTNDFSALLAESQPTLATTHPLLQSQHVTGTCRVMCFSPRHDLTMPQMSLPDIRLVVDAWAEQVSDLGQSYAWVQVFENKGAVMGCSNPHPHGQIWGQSVLPNEVVKEDLMQSQYWQSHGRHLLLDYLQVELEQKERLVVENEHWVVVVPYWAVWPFETLLLPRRAVQHLPQLQDVERTALADILKRLLSRYDQLFQVSFPYSMGWHGVPFLHGQPDPSKEHWQLHAHFLPPLLRSATVKKFLVGYEMLAEAQRDLTAEQAASRLRDLPETPLYATA
ncbi:MAG TPA: UDP-glucose--hexose-1-phosphate uridylyltransferase [Anaerolineales bacterium]|nr:UDP-glucose--hexose-1-phosphate uridylyltransferase [Anaerolineales bacterium]